MKYRHWDAKLGRVYVAVAPWALNLPRITACVDMVLDEIRRYRRRQKIGEFLQLMVSARREHREWKDARSECVDLAAYRDGRR